MDSLSDFLVVKVKISIISLSNSTFIIAAQSPTGETGGGGGDYRFFTLLLKYQTVYWKY